MRTVIAFRFRRDWQFPLLLAAFILLVIASAFPEFRNFFDATTAAWAGAAGSASAAWAALKAATLPEERRRSRALRDGAADLIATEILIRRLIEECIQLKARVMESHETWNAARTELYQAQASLDEGFESRKQSSHEPASDANLTELEVERIRCEIEEADAARAFSELSRYLESILNRLNAVPLVAIREFDLQAAVHLASAKYSIMTAIQLTQMIGCGPPICELLDKVRKELINFVNFVEPARRAVRNGGRDSGSN